jgi:hypothetical protein
LVYFAFFVFFFIYLLHFLRFCIPAPQIKLFDLASLLTCVFGYSSTFSPFPLFSRFLWLRGTWSYGSFFFSPDAFPHIFLVSSFDSSVCDVSNPKIHQQLNGVSWSRCVYSAL